MNRRFRVRGLAFTLVELLVVIAVIMILASIVTPVVHKVRKRAWQVQCVTNLKNLHMATWDTAYSSKYLPYDESEIVQRPDDNTWYERRGWVAYGNYNLANNYNGGTWGGRRQRWWGTEGERSVTNGTIWKSIGKNYDAYVCPTINRWLKGQYAPDPRNLLTMDNVYRTYHMNKRANHRKITNIKNASKMVLYAETHPFYKQETPGAYVEWRPAGVRMSEYGWMRNDANAYDSELNGEYRNVNYPWECIGWWHYGRGNVVFIDGHTEALRWSDTTNACAGGW